MSSDTVSPPWTERVAEELHHLGEQGALTKQHVLSTLEAAGEMKTVRLKILLARALEILCACRFAPDNCSDFVDDDILEQIADVVG